MTKAPRSNWKSFNKMNDYVESEIQSSSPVDFYQKFNSILEANYQNEDFCVQEIGRQYGLSRSQVHRKCLRLFGIGPNLLINIYRLRKARVLLISTNLSVVEIADACGFNSSSYFIKCYKATFGKTPGRLRKS